MPKPNQLEPALDSFMASSRKGTDADRSKDGILSPAFDDRLLCVLSVGRIGADARPLPLPDGAAAVAIL